MKATKKSPISVTFNVEPSKTRLGGKIRLSWSVLNNSEKKVQVLGYQLQFIKADMPEPNWKKKRDMITGSPHVAMELWPKETRTYEWYEVTPDYYGITTPGMWICFVRLAYSISPSAEWTFTEPKMGAVLVESSPTYAYEHETLRKVFMDNIQTIVTRHLGWDEMPQVQRELRFENRGVADLVLYTSSGKVAVVEFKEKISDRHALSHALNQLSRNVDGVLTTLAKSRETIWPVLCVTEVISNIGQILSTKNLERRGLMNLLVFVKTQDQRLELKTSYVDNKNRE